ncbi:hypothetical protein BGX38DRAFT_1127749 [Terfezia claveryi]|nr:hypothetical protein BGX38DRAFT_1127749 [Terfezia claveryi]
MNTVKSFWIGWGALIIAGGGAYYYAKRDIDASRREKFRKLQHQQQLNANLEYDATRTGSVSQQNLRSRGSDHDPAFAPSEEATADPAPTRHEPDTNGQREVEKSKYEAAVPYRTRKGDRFS